MRLSIIWKLVIPIVLVVAVLASGLLWVQLHLLDESRSVRLLGIGTQAIEHVPAGVTGSIDADALEDALGRAGDRPTVLCLQAGELNTGVFDPFGRACSVANEAGAWVHIDGAFGLWVATSRRYRHLLNGADLADSWATDAHRWLNV